MYLVMATNYVDEYHSATFHSAIFAVLFAIACYRGGRSMGVDIYERPLD